MVPLGCNLYTESIALFRHFKTMPDKAFENEARERERVRRGEGGGRSDEGKKNLIKVIIRI